MSGSNESEKQTSEWVEKNPWSDYLTGESEQKKKQSVFHYKYDSVGMNKDKIKVRQTHVLNLANEAQAPEPEQTEASGWQNHFPSEYSFHLR